MITSEEWYKQVNQAKQKWKERPRLKFGCEHEFINDDDTYLTELCSEVKFEFGIKTMKWYLIRTFVSSPEDYFTWVLKCVKCGGYTLGKNYRYST